MKLSTEEKRKGGRASRRSGGAAFEQPDRGPVMLPREEMHRQNRPRWRVADNLFYLEDKVSGTI